MVKNLIVTLILLFSVSYASLYAQSRIFQCGTSGEHAEGMIERLKANKKLIEDGLIQLRNNTVYIPVKFHLVAQDDGSRRVKEANVLEMLCATNDDYADQNIQFYIKGDFNYINNDEVFENHQATQRGVMTFSRDNQALNVFLLERVSQNPFVGGYYTNLYDWIVIRNSDVNSSYVLTHEIGHFFTLPHPFRGWDNEAFEPSEEGEKAPLLSPLGIRVEKADGSNCEDAGDLICDTPADYNAFGSICNPPVSILDPDSLEISPDRRLFMSYFQCEPRTEYYFTPMQKELMAADLAAVRRRSLVNANPSTTAIVETTTTNIFPADESTVNINNGVRFEWAAVEHANRYLIEIDRLPNFSSPAFISFVANETSVVVDGLADDATYFWRVRPFNEYSVCQEFGQRSQFRTTTEMVTSVSNLESVQDWKVFPNPSAEGYFHLFLNSKSRIFGDVIVSNSAGQEVMRLNNQSILPGENTIKINTNDWNAGLFTILFTTGEGYLYDKIVVIK